MQFSLFFILYTSNLTESSLFCQFKVYVLKNSYSLVNAALMLNLYIFKRKIIFGSLLLVSAIPFAILHLQPLVTIERNLLCWHGDKR